MKIVGETSVIEKKINGKILNYLKIREYSRDGKCNEAELFCKLTKKAQEQLNICECLECEIPIEIKDGFFAVDRYFKGEEQYTKPTLIISDLEIRVSEKDL